MASLALDGLASGLDTTNFIKSLMQVETVPRNLLVAKQTTTQSFVTALQGLNTRMASLGAAAKKAADPASWQVHTATSSAPSTATATASSGAQVGSLTFSVDAVATAQVTLTNPFSADAPLTAAVPPVLTIRKSDGSLVEITAQSGSAVDLAKAISDNPDAGVKATAVRVLDGDTPVYRLQLTGAATGAQGSFELFVGTATEVEAATAGPRVDSTSVRTAADATVTLWKGTAAEQSVTQSSNTFTGLMGGIDITVKAVTGTGEPVTVTVASDLDATKKLASSLVGAIGVVMNEIASQSKTSVTTDETGRTVVTGGRFTGDSAVRGINQQLMTAVGYPVEGRSPASAGITMGKDGTFAFDEEKFAAAYAADPAGTQAVVAGIAARVETLSTQISDPRVGSLSLKIQGQESLVKSYGTQIEGMERRLMLRQQSLEKTYSALEVTLSNLNSQGSWLAGQLAALTPQK